MNKEKYIKKIIRKRFISDSKFKKCVLEFGDNDKRIICKKVRTKNDISEYIKKLNEFGSQNFLLYPRTNFSTRGFRQPIDVIILDSGFNVLDIKLNLPPNVDIDFESCFYSILLMESNKSRFLNITPGMKMKMKKYIHEKDSVFNRV